MLEKAKLVEVRWRGNRPEAEKVPGGKEVPVQFNPQTLKLTFANEDNSGAGSPPRQSTGSGTSKLAVELLFDTTADGSDVRVNTKKIAYFLMAAPGKAQPGLSFEWGSLIFRGVVKSIDETLDYFSEEGVPLRATIALNVARPKIEFIEPRPGNGQRPAGGPAPATGATTPLEPARSDDNMQSLAARNGNSGDWKSIASANNIDDPLRLPPGSLINMNA
jgi:contractile injection system tube protein